MTSGRWRSQHRAQIAAKFDFLPCSTFKPVIQLDNPSHHSETREITDRIQLLIKPEMSVIDTRRPPSATGRLKRIFSTSQSQAGLGKKNPPVTIPQSIPGQGRELSITELDPLPGKTGRYIRVYCGSVCPSAIFKTVFVQNDDTVASCVAKVLILLEKEGEHVVDMCTLYEVIGRLPANSQAITEANVVIDPGETFTELSARSLPTNIILMEVFSLMAPAPGLCRRLELRKCPSSPSNGSDSSIIQHRARSASLLKKASSRTAGNGCVAPYCPFLLLLKGSRPEQDLIIQSFYSICREKSSAITMGTSERDDIRLFPWPEARNGRENFNANENGYSTSKAPIRFEARTKSIWMSVVSTYNAIQPDNPLTITLNWETLTDSCSFPVNRCLEPGDILRVESHNLTYVFIYKDSDTVPEHKLSLGFLTLPQIPSTKPPTGVNGSRSAARTARIDALVRRNSNSSNAGGSNVFPNVADVESVIGVLFPRLSNQSKYPSWGENGGILPDVGISAGCMAHLLRSLVKYGADTGINVDDVTKEICHTLTRELENLNKLASQHLIPAIWEAAFCTYLAKYLTFGWLKELNYNGGSSSNGVGSNLPKIIVTESRRSSRLRSVENGSNCSTPNTTTDSHSDVFASPIQRPRQLHVTSGGFDSNHATSDVANLPLFSHLREMLSNEAELVMNEAVQQSLSAGSRKVTKLCRLFGGALVGSDIVRQIREAQASLFDRLDWTGNAISQALTVGTHPTDSSIATNANGAIRLTQAQPYIDRGDSRMSAANTAKEHDNGDSNSIDSSVGRNNSSVIDSDVEGERDVTSPSGLSSLNNDDEMRSTPGEEEDTGFGSSNSGVSTKCAQQRVESIFFCRFLVGFTKLIIAEFVNNRELLINWETGTQLVNLVKALRKWMHNAGVQNYNNALQLLNDFARLMATPRQELVSVCLPFSFRELHFLRRCLIGLLPFFASKILTQESAWDIGKCTVLSQFLL
nr:multiple pdz domain protein [Hymenolepis microstoma]